jgi:hypothetical protein
MGPSWNIKEKILEKYYFDKELLITFGSCSTGNFISHYKRTLRFEQ